MSTNDHSLYLCTMLLKTSFLLPQLFCNVDFGIILLIEFQNKKNIEIIGFWLMHFGFALDSGNIDWDIFLGRRKIVTLKTCWRRLQNMSWRHLQDVLKTDKCLLRKNGKLAWNHRPYCWYFCLNLKNLGWPYREYIKAVKNCNFCEELLREKDFEAVLAIFCGYDYSVTLPRQFGRSLQFRKLSQMLLVCYVCWIAKIYQSITMKKRWLLTY